MSKSGFIYEISNPQPSVNNFSVSSHDYIVINDSNNNVYVSNQINFNSSSVIGAEPSKGILLSEATIQIPFNWTVRITDGTFIDTPKLIYACCLKNHYALIDKIFVGLGSVQDLANSSAYFRNVYINEDMKRRTEQENKLLSEISTCEFDNDKSLILYKNNNFRGELNNLTGITPVDIEISREFINKAIMDRNINRFRNKTNKGKYGKISESLFDVANVEDEFTQDGIEQSYTPYYELNAGRTEINFYDVVTLRLADLFSFFKELNVPLAQLSGFTLKIVLNNGVSTVTYPSTVASVNPLAGAAYARILPVAETYQSSSGFTCPWLISSVAFAGSDNLLDGSDGIMIRQTVDGTGVKISVSGKVGWGNNTLQCRITIPQVKLNPVVARGFFSEKNVRTVLFNDFHVDEIKNVAGNRSINHEIGQTLQRARRLYIIPFLSNTNASGANTMVYPYQSCLTSAPITCSKLMLRDLQVRVGGTNVYPNDNLKYSWQFYDTNKFLDLNDTSGNSSNSVLHKGLITKSNFLNAYGVYTVDIAISDYQMGAGSDDASKRISVQWQNVGNPLLNYDFLLLMEYQKEISINLSTCTLDKNPQIAS